jgi:transposase
MSRRKSKKRQAPKRMPVVHPTAAGIDIGSEEHWVAVPEGSCEESIRRFGAFTADLHALADWLEEVGVTTVAMESTGVYWIPLFQILERRGFEVRLANAHHVKSVPGRKSDVQDCRWIQRLHTFGLVQGSFRPNDQTCVLRSYLRHRETLVEEATAHIQRMQKALTEMNVLLHKVISDITGTTGLRIIDAILDGERDAHALASLRDPRTLKTANEIANALLGDWREEHLFVLAQERQTYAFLQERIAKCEERIAATLETFETRAAPEEFGAGPKQKKREHEDLRKLLHRMVGIDLTLVPGLQAITVLTLISEVGLDLERFPSEKHFTSWLGLCPRNDITGGKVIRRYTTPVANRATQALRMAAQAAGRSQTAIGAFYRRKRAQSGPKVANKATAHKIARIVYILLTRGESYVEPGIDAYEERYRKRTIRNLKRRARNLGFDLVERDAA